MADFIKPYVSSFVTNYVSGGVTPPAFSPTDIAGLELWLDASDASTITETSGAVSQWDDKSGNAHHVTSSGSSRPTTGTRTISGLNVLDFNGIANRMERADGLGITGNPNLVAFVVYNQDSVPDVFNFTFTLVDNTGTGGNTIGLAAADGSFRFNNGNQVFTSATNGATEIAVWERSAGDTYGDGRFFRDGVEQTESANGNPTGTPNLLDQLTVIGASKSGGSYVGQIDGMIAEIVVYNAALSASEKNQVDNYLADKWKAGAFGGDFDGGFD